MNNKDEIELIIKKKYPENVLLIFVGYADDANEEANCICELKWELQKDLDRINRRSPSIFTNVEFFNWKENANLGKGGQEYAIDPYLNRANIGIFVFRQRVGAVTWQELDKYRGISNLRKPLFAIFPKDPYFGVHASQRDASLAIWDLEDKQKILTEDWTEKNSKSVTPVEPYEDISHLIEIVKKRLEDVFDLLVPDSPGITPPQDSQIPIIIENEKSKPYIDRITDQVNYEPDLVKYFREKLRPETKLKSKDKSDTKFLINNGYIRNNRLTTAGVLLFGNPLSHISSAITQCVVYKGNTETASKSAFDNFDESLLKQIENAFDFVTIHVETRERPVGSKITSETISKYPMRCVREMIANALCHREYDDPARNTYVRIFTDFIKILSPGRWFKEELPMNKEIPISKLVGESVPRNMSLARAFTSVKIVEREGSGLKTAIRDCKLVNAPEPSVVENDGYVIVRIFPRRDWDNLNVLHSYQDNLSNDKEQVPKKIYISYSHKDRKWVERLRKHLSVLEMEGLIEFWDDSKIQAGDDWFPEIENAISEAEIVILMISPDFLISPFIRDVEMKGVLERKNIENKKIIPILLRPCPWKHINWLNSIQVFPASGEALSSLRESKVEENFANLSEIIYNVLTGRSEEEAEDEGLPVKISLGKMPVSGKHLFGRKKELELLTRAWDKADDKNPGMVILKAWGGVGKTALVNHWLNLMQGRNYAGAKNVYAWSFYSQGAAEGKQASADEFFNQTLQWFGEPVAQEETLSPEEKAIRLARLVKREKNLLILDGLEPLQYPPGELHGFDGELKDRGMRRFLKELAAHFLGLCIITTRAPVSELRDREGGGVKTVGLEHLDQACGSELLKSLGATGTRYQLAGAVEEYGGHALALTLLGNYISRSFQGDIRKRDRIPSLGLERKQGGHAMRVMGAYEKWLGNKSGKSVELDILRIMGLFDRPAEPGAVAVLKNKRAIPGVTDTVAGLPEEEWNEALANLRDSGLLAAPPIGTQPGNANAGLDCHPLVREYFSGRLKDENPKGWRKAHELLYEYYKAVPEKKLPDTLEEMEPLFAAVAHGCMAGKHREALDDVYITRIQRGGKINYCISYLGAFGSDLAALSHFFDRPWGQPAEGLPEEAKAAILNWAAFRLRALGRLHEAVQPMEAGLEIQTSQKDWKNAAIAASNLSGLLLNLGRVSESGEAARRAVTHADESKDKYHMMSKRTTLADALNQSGQWQEAGKLFQEAEAIQKEFQPEFPLLYSLQGYRYCELLLDRDLAKEARERATKTLKWAEKYLGLLDQALDHISLGRAALQEKSQTKGSPNYTEALTSLQLAVEGLRKAGTQDHLPRGLFARASCFRLQGDFQNAESDLTEAYEIAQSGGMLLFYVDYHLESARLWKDKGNMEKTKQHRDEAKKWMEQTGYLRREKEINEIF